MPAPLGLMPALPLLTVTQLTQRVRDVLDAELDDCWVAGEVSNHKRAASGHVYFTLKDERSQIAAVMFRSAAASLAFVPADGMAVIVHGRVSLYPVRGTLQLYIDTMEPRGVGALQLAFEQLKQRLAAEGLFDERRKRDLPLFPRGVGVVTAMGGAAVRDILVTLRRRWPPVRVVIRPVPVQGSEAPPEIVAAIADLNRVEGIDVLIVGRGGGSIEDLWAFNDERVARAIAASQVPVVSAVGHEIDVTVADLVADRRAATPTAAATLVVPDARDVLQQVALLTERLGLAVRRCITLLRTRLGGLAVRVRDPRQTLALLQQRVDELGERLQRAVRARLQLARERVVARAGRLQAVSPLAVLHRGFAIARRPADGVLVRDVAVLTVGDRLDLQFAVGQAGVVVERILPAPQSDREPHRA